MSEIAKEFFMLQRQVKSLNIFAEELQQLEQWDMPCEFRERALKIRNQSAPMFFNLTINLLRDALIQNLANILDSPETSGRKNLTLESVIQSHHSASIKSSCQQKLAQIRESDTYRQIKLARNRILSHSDHDTISNYDTISFKEFSNLKLDHLRIKVGEILKILSEVSGLSKEEFIPFDWRGVSDLFTILEQHASGE